MAIAGCISGVWLYFNQIINVSNYSEVIVGCLYFMVGYGVGSAHARSNGYVTEKVIQLAILLFMLWSLFFRGISYA